ncbi:MAG TPA: TonB-dependent receptor [Bryobacteraceae bacterium]|nr:TonB-dependent receptor [Bryobacteraceae bacterium]
MKQSCLRGFRFTPKLLMAVWMAACGGAPAWGQNRPPADLTQATLEELANLQVTSVSKKEQSLSKAGAAVFVITQEDIRRSGMQNIPDLLRMAPGVDVARLDANAWAISIRGFNDRYSNKVLVLIDGRSVYSEAFSGVLWDQLNVPLEDIDRIEVIRGPGGTVWGANAVNGVINIITKSSKETQGGLITAETGSKENLESLVQYGGKIGGKGTYRAFGNYFNIEPALLAGGVEAADGWHGSHGGFRSDWTLSANDTLTVQGDLSQTAEGQTLTAVIANQLPLSQTFNDRVTVGSGDVLGQYNHAFSNGSELTLMAYFDYVHRNDVGDYTEQKTDTELQYHFAIGSRQDLVAGAGYRLTDDRVTGLVDGFFAPDHRRDSLFSAFLQDEIDLTHNLALTLGTKVEHNAFTGFEYEPSARLVWTPVVRQSLWFSAARAIRQPSLLDSDAHIASSIVPMGGGNFGLVELSGNPALKAETVLDYELGYRNQVNRRMSFDVTTFWSNYTNLRTTEPGAPFFSLSPGPPHVVIPLTWGNLARAQDYGAELSGTWDVTSRWRLSPGFSMLHMNIKTDPASGDTGVAASAGSSPQHQAQLRSSVKLSHRLEWDTSVYFVGSLTNGGVLTHGPIPAYTRLDTTLGWAMGESVYFSVSGQNLLAPRHFEFLSGNLVQPTEVERSVVGKITWRF